MVEIVAAGSGEQANAVLVPNEVFSTKLMFPVRNEIFPGKVAVQGPTVTALLGKMVVTVAAGCGKAIWTAPGSVDTV